MRLNQFFNFLSDIFAFFATIPGLNRRGQEGEKMVKMSLENSFFLVNFNKKGGPGPGSPQEGDPEGDNVLFK